MKVKCDHCSKFSNWSNWKEEAWKKVRASTGFEPMTSAIPVRCSTNWAMKPHIGSKVNLLSSFLPVQWNHTSLSSAMITLHFHLIPQYRYELFHIYFTWFHCTGRNELHKLTLLPMCGFIAQLVEHRTGIAEVMGSNPVEALIFFRLLLSNCFNWKIYCDDHTSLSVCNGSANQITAFALVY